MEYCFQMNFFFSTVALNSVLTVLSVITEHWGKVSWCGCNMATICIQRLISRRINPLQLDNRSGLMIVLMIPIENTPHSPAVEWQWQLDNESSGEKNVVLMRRAERRVYLAYGPSVVSCCASPSLKKHTHTQQISTENRLDYIQRIVTDWESSSEWVCVPSEGFEPILIIVNAIHINTRTGIKKNK